MLKIKPEVVLAHIEKTIKEFMSEPTLAPEFKVDFIIMPQTLKFNMLDDDQVKLIIAVVTTMINRLKEMILASGKTEMSYSMAYPFESRTEPDKALVIIDIQYRQDGKFIDKRITVSQA
ncbi:hypothetical protein [[Eubacterium] cellulosolvens]